MSGELVHCARALVSGNLRNDYAFVVRDGTITDAGDVRDVRARVRHLASRSFPPDRLVVPGFSNGHSHAYQILLRGWADDWPFSKWRSDALYRVVPQLTPHDVYWTFVAAFSEMLAGGITTVAEFFYLNGEGNAHAEAAIRAARETGIRLVLARTWMDAPYAPREFREEVDVAAARTGELMDRYPDANVCVAPHSLHAASHAMIRAAAEFSRERDCMLHVHVAEARYEGEQSLAQYGRTPIALLDDLGALGERTVAIHAIYLDDDDRALLARTGARVIHNPMTNQYLGDGICDATALRALGVTLGLGTDAASRRQSSRRCARPHCCRKFCISTGPRSARPLPTRWVHSTALARCASAAAISSRARTRITSCSTPRRSIRGRRRSTPSSIEARIRGCRRRLSAAGASTSANRRRSRRARERRLRRLRSGSRRSLA